MPTVHAGHQPCPGTLPTLLSQTGVYSNTPNRSPTNGLIPYSPIVPLWSDGAQKSRYFSIPNTGGFLTPSEQIAFLPTNTWTFPSGTVFVKNFDMVVNTTNNTVQRLETRLLVRNTNGGVYGVTYAWNSSNTDANLLTTSSNLVLSITNASGVTNQTWYFPSPTDCLTCHTAPANYVLGVNTRQLNTNYTYTNLTGNTDNQLRALNRIGLFYPAFDEGTISNMEHLSALGDTNASLVQRSRSYLDANCAQCHQPGGTGITFDARYDTPLASQNISNYPAAQSLLVDFEQAYIVEGNDTWRSMLLTRINTNNLSVQMPPLARNVIDTNAVAVISAWIGSMSGLPTLAPPTITPSGGGFTNSVSVTLASTNVGASIYYTLDGSLPTTNSTLYSGAITLTNSLTLTANCFKTGSTNSIAALGSFSLANTGYQSVILGDGPVSYWPMQETTGPTINDIVTTNAGPFNGTVQISTDGFSNGATDGEGFNWGIIHETFTNSTSAAATDGATYHFGGPGGLTGVSGDTAIYFTNLNGQLNNAQIAMGTGGTGAYEAQLDSSTFTVEAWLNVPTYTIGWTSNSYQVPLGLNAYGNSGGTANGWFMGVKTDSSGSTAYGEMFFEAGTGTANTSNGPSAQVFSGKWVYTVQEYNGTATVIYTNGTLMVSNAQTYKPLSNSATHELPFIIGSETAYYFGGSTFSGNTRADFWDGGVSHVAYYNYALSASHITNHYYYGTNASFAGAFKAPVEPAFKPTIGATLTPALLTGSSAKQFQMQVSAVANQNYTLQMSTDLSSGNWVSLYTTNSTTNTTFVLTDPNAATNKQRFYRVLIGP